VNTAWIIIGGGIVVAAVILLQLWLRRVRDADLGQVSAQWIAEQRRFGEGHDRQR
jgi:hypothetical protein